ncbi:Lp29 family lipoprotein [Leptospira noguchii]|uniref:Lp29 family lipoprotein n=1 Tax=Leptospira noguchii TaxID=28182 RepID=UPI001FB5D2EF|nr:hypothetical protein [Leptospira noguchii]UOG42315.1 hypothetical protein MAL05_04380 [Leptospira noguchii]
MKNCFLIISIIIILVGCNHRFNLKEFPVSETVHVDHKLKIVYLGFRNYATRVTERVGRTTTYTADLVYTKRTIPKLTNGFFVDELKSNDFRKDLSSEQIGLFISEYLNVVKSSGAQELSYLIDAEKVDGKSVFKLKNIPVDYYVVGVHGPPFAQDENIGITFVEGFSRIFSILTLGLIPIYSSKVAITEVKVYDKNLKLINKIEYNNSYSSIAAVWILPKPDHCKVLKCNSGTYDSPPDFVYSGMGPRIEEDVLKIIQKNP